MIEAIRTRAGFNSPMEDVGIVSSTPKIRASVQVNELRVRVLCFAQSQVCGI